MATKLSSPRLHRDHVPRHRLVDRLEGGSDRTVTLVCAPAGSGKSTLLSEWLRASGRPSGWISLDERDNELVGFVGYVLAAVRAVFPTLPMETRDLLQALTPPPVAALADSLANLLAQIPEDFILVLDDYHVISDPQIHEFLQRLLRHPPARMHLAVTTRSDPPWPLARLRARGQMTELRYEDLLFTQEEAATLLRHTLGDAIDHDLAVVLHEESEGWAAGLQLMMLALKGQPAGAESVSRAAAAGKNIETYLLDDVFASQTPVVQDRLCNIAILGRFNASLCEAVCAGEPGQEAPPGWGASFLSDLYHANLFIIPLDAGHEFFRFHHLFQHFLVRRLRERCSARDIAALHQRASRWFEERGFIEEALDQALVGGDVTAAADIVARRRHELYNQDQFARLTRWLRLLPPEAKEHHAEVLLAEARIATMNWRFTEATVFLDHAERELAEASPQSPQATLAATELVALRSILHFWAGDAQRVEEGSRHVLATAPAHASHMRGLAHTGMATSAYLQGDLSHSLAYLNEQLASISPQSTSYAWLLQTQAFLYLIDGDWTHLGQTATRLLRVSEELELADHEALAHYFLGVSHYARNELAAAEAQLTKAVDARFIMRLMWWAQAAGVLALTYQAQGRPDEARQIVEDAQAFLLERHATRLLPGIGAFQAEVDRRQGHVAAAVAWTRHADPIPLTWALSLAEPRVVQARALLAQGETSDLEQTAILLAELHTFCARLPNRRLRCEVDALAALLDDRRGQREEALQTVRLLVREVEPGGWMRLFVDLGEPMERLLRQLAGQGATSHAVARVLAAFPAPHVSASLPDQRHLEEPLSRRELEILTLLAARDSNNEIAARLFIAPATVKRHTLSIYRKLQVNGRREAVNRASELGLLPAM